MAFAGLQPAPPGRRATWAEAEAEGLRIPTRLTAGPRLSERLHWLRPLAVAIHRLRRRIAWLASSASWAAERRTVDLPVRVRKHSSLLLRELSEDEMALQHGKVVNLRLAAARLDGLVIRPGETFSFNRTVGSCTRRKGYVEGMRLSNGDAEAGVGGGICQLANLLHWLFLHSPLTVVERSEHSFDPFPDKGRVLPWGVGCSIAYNYVDLVVRNDTPITFQLRVWLDVRHLRGLLLADQRLPVRYHFEAREERFFRLGEEHYRANQIWRSHVDPRTGAVLSEELVKKNCALVKYTPAHVAVIDVVPDPASGRAHGSASGPPAGP